MRGDTQELPALGISINKNKQENKYYVWEAGRIEAYEKMDLGVFCKEIKKVKSFRELEGSA